MPCYQSTNLPGGVTTTGRTSYTTEADCLAACKEGACCEGTTCSVKPACQCDGAGKVFKGAGTTCTPNPCTLLCSPTCAAPGSVTLAITVGPAFANDYIYGLDVRDPTDSRIPSWGTAAIQSAPQTFSGEYVLRFYGQTARSGQPLSAVYKYTTPTTDITFLWNCVSPFSPSGYPYTSNPALIAGVPPTTGLLVVNMSRDMSGCVASLGSPEFGMAGPLISQVCQGQTLQSANWPPASSMLNQSVGIFFTNSTPDFTEVVAGLSGVQFSYGVQITQA